jgi:hypothetical protein
MTMTENMRTVIINQGVKNLKEYGYPNVDEKNILTDMIYSAFFKQMLNNNRGLGHDEVINELLTEIEGESKL